MSRDTAPVGGAESGDRRMLQPEDLLARFAAASYQDLIKVVMPAFPYRR